MNPEISEFSYGYALTRELIATFGLEHAGAPEFATQYAEGKAGGGWDLKLPALPIYLQYKRSYPMVSRRAKESHLFPTLPFFRMHLHPRDDSDQHKLLLDLENRGNLVLYAAPGFSKSSELSNAYSQERMAVSSLFLKPSATGLLPDDEGHWVAFLMSPSLTYFCSEPKPLRVEPPKVLFSRDSLLQMAQSKNLRLDESFFPQIADELLEVYTRRRSSSTISAPIDQIRQLGERRSPPEFAQLLAQTLFGCELLVFAPK